MTPLLWGCSGWCSVHISSYVSKMVWDGNCHEIARKVSYYTKNATLVMDWAYPHNSKDNTCMTFSFSLTNMARGSSSDLNSSTAYSSRIFICPCEDFCMLQAEANKSTIFSMNTRNGTVWHLVEAEYASSPYCLGSRLTICTIFGRNWRAMMS